MTHEQLITLQNMVQDRYGFIAAQIQSDYTPDYQQLERWKRLGLVPDYITPETFASSVPAEMHLIRNAFIMGRLADAVEQGASFEQAMRLALTLPLKKPDLAAIAIAEQQTAMYLTDNAQDLATKVGQLAIKKRNEQIRQMAIDYHARKQKRTVLDEDLKREAGEEIPDRYVENWQQFKSELYHALDEKDRDLDRVAYYEITDAQKQGQAAQLLADGNVDKLVYKRPMPTACAQCKHLYLMPNGVTPRLFKLSEMISNSTNIGRKPHPTKGGKVVPGGRADGQETLKATAGLVHPWCACLGPYTATGYESWVTPEQKEQIKKHKGGMKKSHDVSGEARDRLGKWTGSKKTQPHIADETKRKAIKQFLSGEPITELTGKEFEKGEVSLKAQVLQWFDSIGGMAHNPELGEVLLDKDGVKTSIGHGVGRSKASAFAAVPDVISHGEIIDRAENWKGRGYSTVLIGAPVSIAGEKHVVFLVVKQSGKQRYHLHEVFMLDHLQEAAAISTGARADSGTVGLSGTAASGDILSIAVPLFKSKTEQIGQLHCLIKAKSTK